MIDVFDATVKEELFGHEEKWFNTVYKKMWRGKSIKLLRWKGEEKNCVMR